MTTEAVTVLSTALCFSTSAVNRRLATW